MIKKKRAWIFAAVFAMAAVQGTIFAESPETETSVEAVTETTTEQLPLPEETEEIQVKIKKSMIKQRKRTRDTVKKTADGQTLLDVSQGNITITSTGATGGGYKQ